MLSAAARSRNFLRISGEPASPTQRQLDLSLSYPYPSIAIGVAGRGALKRSEAFLAEGQRLS